MPVSRLVLMLRETPGWASRRPIASRMQQAENRASRSRSRGPSCAWCSTTAPRSSPATPPSDPRFLGQHSIVSQGVHCGDGGAAVRQREGAGSALRRQPDPRRGCSRRSSSSCFTLLANMAAVKITNSRLAGSGAGSRADGAGVRHRDAHPARVCCRSPPRVCRAGSSTPVWRLATRWVAISTTSTGVPTGSLGAHGR